MLRFIVLFASFALSTPIGALHGHKATPTTIELRKDAEKCASMLYQFGLVQRDFFPEGLEKAKNVDVRIKWPPSKSYSWRVAVLPFMEQWLVYKELQDASNDFKIAATVVKRRIGKSHKMPDWLTLPRWNEKPTHTIYRRVMTPDKPKRFIVVESADLVLWLESGDDLILAPGKALPKMGGNFQKGFFALCGDRKVRYLSKKLSEKQIRQALIGGGSVPPLRCEYVDQLKQDIRGLDVGGKK